ncbi:MAG: hypothetical protein ABI402_03115 [Ferruginibacter sp.]
MRSFLLSLLMLSCNDCFAQNISEQKLLQTIKSGFCEDNHAKCIAKQLRYLNACDQLGDYYLKQKKYLPAFKYYTLPMSLNGHTTMFISDAALKLRNDVIGKAGNMILLGQGRMKNKKEAFYYHNQLPYTLSNDQRLNYSNIYFNSLKDTCYFSGRDANNQLLLVISINPFFVDDSLTIVKVRNEVLYIKKILSADSSMTCVLGILPGSIPISEEGQGHLQLFLNKVSKQLIAEYPGRVDGELVIGEELPMQFRKNGIVFPALKISLNKK